MGGQRVPALGDFVSEQHTYPRPGPSLGVIISKKEGELLIAGLLVNVDNQDCFVIDSGVGSDYTHVSCVMDAEM